ncbi:uncharacterized protein BJ212DRAFT_1296489 [Suillus subaureus]|uniref:Uncharacterized protein n=1 Tax=Suillus subaureus TaxID=48587 RepID=A0A9P7JH31_9AGAM|nr:uncharacterized protein BJ212DRAFT_1296489 [Suillus subaureus]KAG1822417.1 hypothetical protein BJ212DRAFT_1296489 [Suillus subaureus]
MSVFLCPKDCFDGAKVKPKHFEPGDVKSLACLQAVWWDGLLVTSLHGDLDCRFTCLPTPPSSSSQDAKSMIILKSKNQSKDGASLRNNGIRFSIAQLSGVLAPFSRHAAHHNVNGEKGWPTADAQRRQENHSEESSRDYDSVLGLTRQHEHLAGYVVIGKVYAYSRGRERLGPRQGVQTC